MSKIIIALSVALLSVNTYAAPTCKDFSTQKEAQRYFEKHGAKNLDRDGDGEACECNKGGSREGSSQCRKR